MSIAGRPRLGSYGRPVVAINRGPVRSVNSNDWRARDVTRYCSVRVYLASGLVVESVSHTGRSQCVRYRFSQGLSVYTVYEQLLPGVHVLGETDLVAAPGIMHGRFLLEPEPAVHGQGLRVSSDDHVVIVEAIQSQRLLRQELMSAGVRSVDLNAAVRAIEDRLNRGRRQLGL